MHQNQNNPTATTNQHRHTAKQKNQKHNHHDISATVTIHTLKPSIRTNYTKIRHWNFDIQYSRNQQNDDMIGEQLNIFEN